MMLGVESNHNESALTGPVAMAKMQIDWFHGGVRA